jgi:hypothetical protein
MSQLHLFWTRLATNPGNAESDLSRNLGKKHVAVFDGANGIASRVMTVMTGLKPANPAPHLAVCQTDHSSFYSTMQMT